MGRCVPGKAPSERMPPSEAPTNLNEPKGPADRPSDENLSSGAPTETIQEAGSPAPETSGNETSDQENTKPFAIRGSRWVDYDTHELLEMISELEDERRWARLREGVLWALLFHILLISSLTWIPKYVFKVPPVIDPIDAIKNRKDLQYLDLPPDALRALQPKVAVKPAPPKQTTVDKKTLEAMNRPAPPTPPAPTPEPAPAPTVQPPVPTQPIPTTEQSQVEAPRPSAVPARPNFAMGSTNPNDQLRDAMRGASRTPGAGDAGPLGGSGLARHPGAGGGVEVLSDTQGVDFRAWLQRWHHETQNTWDPLIPDEVNPPINKQGIVVISFKVLPNGRLMDGSVKLEGRSGDSALDRAAWGALTGSNYPPLPRDFHGPYLELRASFWYNVQPPN
jgi:outer membrane biosynthesis protein TonB